MKPAVRPCILIIRDGWGENPHADQDHANAVRIAAPAVDARLRATCPFTLIRTSGLDVGLPDGVMGNSEVGHQNIGAGRIVDQEIVRISKTIADGRFFQNAELVAAVERCKARSSRLHVMGLCSDAGVHSVLEHLYACVELAAQRGLRQVYVHAITDGRDSAPTSGIEIVRQVEARLRQLGVGQIASVCGRYWAMDRDDRWQRTERAYRLYVHGDAEAAPSAGAALERYYANPVEPTMRGDEFVSPTVISDDGLTPRATIGDGDALVFFNFRGDRPRQIIKSFALDTFPYRDADRTGTQRDMGFSRGPRPDVSIVTLTEYERGLPVRVAFPKPPKMQNIAGEFISRLGLRQFRAAETEKYAHVTFFFNDYREEPFPGEERLLVPSPQVSTYDQQPEMSALELTEGVIARIQSGVDDAIILNYANPDMVGHTGSLPAAVQACRVVDACVGRVLEAMAARGGCAVVTADHGNLEQMIDPATGGPHTAHTTYPVPLYVVGAGLPGSRLREGGRLADVMPTVLHLMGLEPPAEMTGRSLLV
ncbi:MAG: 2,3-bisphosphoglycerate-independent phosphoglycerate mutase [Phycisphaerales bacterium]|nr:2,3-bisphosphoglycerate-independent phosphoglycerate mutase [Phycisphaerales bacterium]